jgi:hypothetical protein
LALISNLQLPGRAWKQQSTVNCQQNHTEETLYEQTRKIHAKGEVYRKQKSAQEEDWL